MFARTSQHAEGKGGKGVKGGSKHQCINSNVHIKWSLIPVVERAPSMPEGYLAVITNTAAITAAQKNNAQEGQEIEYTVVIVVVFPFL
jgi:hypothetical protein